MMNREKYIKSWLNQTVQASKLARSGNKSLRFKVRSSTILSLESTPHRENTFLARSIPIRVIEEKEAKKRDSRC